ncbi:MAG: hypothetical protein JEZ03_04875 [Bacteroidales bacterium]|nr:hypothetical protein [Bacteroidales bacterium]
MNKEQTQKNIQRILKRINQQNEIIFGYEETVPKLEYDLMLDQIRRLYEQYLDYSEIKTQQKKTEIIVEPTKVPEAVVKDVAVESETSKEETSKTDIIVKDEPSDEELAKKLQEELSKIVETDPMIAEELKKIGQYFPSIPDQSPNIEPEVSEIKDKESVSIKTKMSTQPSESLNGDQKQNKDLTGDLFEDQLSLGDQFMDEQTTVYDRVQNKAKDSTLADKISKHSIVSLKSAIGLNDKFAFINDLFNGSLNEYTAAIEQFDEIQTPDEAHNTFNQHLVKYKWSETDETVERFSDYINKRFQ